MQKKRSLSIKFLYKLESCTWAVAEEFMHSGGASAGAGWLQRSFSGVLHPPGWGSSGFQWLRLVLVSGVWVGVLVARWWPVAGALLVRRAGPCVFLVLFCQARSLHRFESTSSFCCTRFLLHLTQQQVPLQLRPPPCVF